MEKFQAVFKILYLLSSVDGIIDDNEVNTISRFYHANYKNVSFDLKEIINSIESLTPFGKIEEFETAVMVFKNSSAASDRENLLEFALELACADGALSKEEKELFCFAANA